MTSGLPVNRPELPSPPLSSSENSGIIVAMSAKRSRFKRPSWDYLPTSIELFETLPSCAKVIVYVIGIIFFFYAIGHYSVGHTLLRVIFSP